jgi:peptidoglycan hydrolase CwlO-like protein
MMSFYEYWASRTACDVLEEMRKCNETRNYCSLVGLIEELQGMCNRMEAGLGDKRQVAQMREDRESLKSEIKKLEKQKKELKSTKESNEPEPATN